MIKLTKHTKINKRNNMSCTVTLTPEGQALASELFSADQNLTIEEIVKIIIKGDITNEINKGDDK